mmetsp:Transcript_10660/g.20694  ORF Transcript_10660/g.20694 Transcript_10660/m.20694 type:complete len:183 (+) Transcript_10660:1149-1697(+)
MDIASGCGVELFIMYFFDCCSAVSWLPPAAVDSLRTSGAAVVACACGSYIGATVALVVVDADDVDARVVEVDALEAVVAVFVEVDTVVVVGFVVVGDVVDFVVVETFEEVVCEDLVDDTVLDVVLADETVVEDVDTAYATNFSSWKLTPPAGPTVARLVSGFIEGSPNVTNPSKGRLSASDL